MKHRNRQGELQYLQCQQPEKLAYVTVCTCFVDIEIPTYFQIILAFIWFILPLQISLRLLQNLNHYEALLPSKRATIPRKPKGRDDVLYDCLYMFC